MGTACSCANDGDGAVEKDILTDEVNASKVELTDEQVPSENEVRLPKTNGLDKNHSNGDGNQKSIIDKPIQTILENGNVKIENVKNIEHGELNGHVPKGDVSEFSPNGVGDKINSSKEPPSSSRPESLIIPEDLSLDNLGTYIKQAQELISNADADEDEELVAKMTHELASLVNRLELAVIRLEKSGGPGTANRAAQSSSSPSSQAKPSSSASKPVAASNLRYDAAHYVYNYDAPWLDGKAVENGHAEVAPQVDFGESNNVEEPMGPWGESCSTPYIVAWDDMMNGPFRAFLDKSKIIGGDVETISKLVEGCFLTQRTFLICATKSAKPPTEADLAKLLEPTGKKIQAVIDFRESNRSSRFFNHLSSISEAIPALSWVTIEPAPSPFIKELGDAGTFYTNRILKEYKDKDKCHVGWTQDWIGIFKEMQSYVKQYHTTGVSWNPKGGRALDNLKDAPNAAGVPPPPPPGPPPPPMMPAPATKSSAGAENDRSQLFAELNKGASVTAGLKKVTSDMQTHKNPSLREGPKPFVKQSSPGPTSSPAAAKQSFGAAPAKEPRLEQEGRKWFVEYQKNNKNIVIDDTSMDQTVYIFKCEGTVVQVKGKLNNIILDSCKKTSLVFDSLVSALEVVNCQSAEIQVTGKLPSCSIEKTDGCQLYLSKDSVGLEVVSSKSTTMNLLIPQEDGQFTELPIPEQFKTQIKNGKLETVCTEIAG